MPQRPPTQSTLSIIDVKDDILVLTNHRFRTVFKVKAINFDLLSPDEQDATIYAYASLINSLDFPLQILVKTRQLNITSYLDYLEQHRRRQSNQVLKAQIESYQSFVEKLVKENNVLFKSFYVVVPFDGITVNKSSIMDPITQLISPAKATTTYSNKEFEEAKAHIEQRTADLIAQFQRIGLQTTRVDSANLVNLFYSLYNPEEDSSEQRVQQASSEYTTTMIHPAIN